MMREEGPFTMEPVAFDLAFQTVKVRVVSSSALRKRRQFCCRLLTEGPHILEVTLGFSHKDPVNSVLESSRSIY